MDKRVSMVSESIGDTTGHADGMVAFVDENAIALAPLETEEEDRALEEQLRKDFGKGMDIFTISDVYVVRN